MEKAFVLCNTISNSNWDGNYFSHPNILFTNHIDNMISKADSKLEKNIKIYHDLGKLRDNFQKYIRGDYNISDKEHSIFGAYIFLKVFYEKVNFRDLMFGFISIKSHHQRELYNFNIYVKNLLGNFDNYDARIFKELSKNIKDVKYFYDVNCNDSDIKNVLEKIKKDENDKKLEILLSGKEKEYYNLADYLDFRGIFSNLVYSDKYEAIFHEKIDKIENNKSKIMFNDFNNYINRFNSADKISELRKDFSDTIFNNYLENRDKRIFKIVGATGIGKTLSSLRIALKMNKKKINYVLPFTNIIEQTYNVFDSIFSDEIDMRQNHFRNNPFISRDNENENVNIDSDIKNMNKFTTQNFGGDINVTTTYQLFYALFGNRNKDFVKFHQLKDSVIIIDEIQSINERLKKDFLKLCEVASEKFNISFIFMSATMPIIDIEHIDLGGRGHFEYFNRYCLKFNTEINSYDGYISKIASLFEKNNSVLCVVNQIDTAKKLYLACENKYKENIYILHGELTVNDKNNIISKINKKLNRNQKILLISTQSIEAGVDLDFDCGIREYAPFSSIIQMAGRVNRNNNKKQGKIFVLGEISSFTNLIYGDSILNNNGLKDLKKIEEKNQLSSTEEYFLITSENTISAGFSQLYKNLNFEEISKLLKIYFDENKNYKTTIYIEPYEGFFDEFKTKYYKILNEKIDKWDKKNKISEMMYNINQYSVSVKKNFVDNVLETKDLLDNDIINYFKFGSVINKYTEGFGFGKEEDIFI